MKKQIQRTFIAAAMSAAFFGISSCKKYTIVEPVSQYGIAQVFSDVSNTYNALVGVYDELQGDNGYGIRISMYYPYDSDEGIVSGNIDNGRRGVGRYQLLLTNSEIANPFRQLYRGIEKANLCIEQIPLMEKFTTGSATEQKELKRMYGEALTLRAQFYHELIRNWGDVPAPMVPAYKQADLFVPQADRDSTYDKILNDLATAIDLLPWRTEAGPRNERITKGAAKALRARIALNRGGFSLRQNGQMERRSDYLTYYQIAKKECEELMARRDQHTLNPSYIDIWRKLTSFQYDPQAEILFEVGAGGGNGNSDSRMGNYDGPNLSNASRYGAGGGGIVMLPNYFYAFDSADSRRDVTITHYQVTSATNIKSQRRLGELNTGKYRRDWRNPLLPGTVLNVGYNWSVIRFADVLLMYAEAVNEINNGPTAEAIAAFEEVRKRAFNGNAALIGTTPTDKAGFFNAIVNERYLEFGHEGIRKFDLLRWNLLATKIAEARTNIQAIRDRRAPYANVPQYIYWRNNGEEIQYFAGATAPATAQPFWRPTQVPSPTTGWTRTDWAQQLTSNQIDSKPLWQGFASFFTPGKSELFPFDQGTLSSYQGKLKQNPGY
ncbi:RagB/SusD family nutrient uptake outer membrane protein [Phnomibacter ginsenosidimutans]|uniref:RagB/SusD family nutrient uptake outer membrane protein n=1 Tax=Phnomibacter ginsenosidimutans TaxID=2676868 RepID=A0A6I6G7F8_9BACT|nr:RagB/SusD family nutrient uptake outer membrane protein [Phnomibacter ginsenosidimutans]QGW28114.1 RagB/SusD family nutrient uptake outer membrane protein [Phnomibacter ginsenosidimutans]